MLRANTFHCKSEVANSKVLFPTSDLNPFQCICLGKHGCQHQTHPFIVYISVVILRSSDTVTVDEDRIIGMLPLSL